MHLNTTDFFKLFISSELSITRGSRKKAQQTLKQPTSGISFTRTFKKRTSLAIANSPCNTDFVTAEHLLQHYQLHEALRRNVARLNTTEGQVYGNLEELWRMAAFMKVIGISGWCTTKKKKTAKLNPNLEIWVGIWVTEFKVKIT